MINLIPVAILLILGLVCWHKYKQDQNTEFNGGAIILWVIGGIWLFFALAAPYSSQLSYFTEVRQSQENIKLYQERRNNLVAVVRTELAKYPEHEKKIIGDIQPQIILSFPALKSNETIVKTVNDIVALEDAVYKLRSNLLKVQTDIFWMEISPWVLYVPSYQSFFGEKNPVGFIGR